MDPNGTEIEEAQTFGADLCEGGGDALLAEFYHLALGTCRVR